MNGQRANAPARIMHAPDASNKRIRREVVAQARAVATSTDWPEPLPRNDIPRVLWAYCKERVPYFEQGDVQSIRRPAALVEDGLSADCKSTAVFIAGLAASAGCSSVVRFAQYPDRPWLSHVYAIVDGVVCDPLLPFGSEEPYIRKEDHTIQMELEVIRGTPAGGVGATTTTYYTPNQLIAQVTDWATWAGYKVSDGSGGIRVRFWPFSGPTAAMLGAHFQASSWPGALFGVRLLAETETLPGFSFQPGMGQAPANSYYYYTQGEANDAVQCVRDYVDGLMREQYGLTPEDVIPAAAWNDPFIPYTRETNTVLGGFFAGIADFFARFNPLLVLGRAAFLSLVRDNYRGLARKMADNDPARVRSRWLGWGGNWAALREAIDIGKDKGAAGVAGRVGKGSNDMSGSETGNDIVNIAAGASGYGALLAAAKPILDVILSALGINLDPPTDAEAEAEVDALDHTDITDDVASGMGSTGTVVAVLVGVAVVGTAAVLLSSPERKRKTAR